MKEQPEASRFGLPFYHEPVVCFVFISIDTQVSFGIMNYGV